MKRFLSDIHKRQAQKHLNFKTALDDLIQEQAVWLVAKTQLKIDLNQIKKAAEDHIAQIMRERKLTKEQLAEHLMQAPYFMTLSQFIHETQTTILQQHLLSTLASQVVVTDEQAQRELEKREALRAKKFDVVFITAESKTISHKKTGTDLITSQFRTLKEIKAKILGHQSLAEIKRQYETDNAVTILGPYSYEKGTFNKEYDLQLVKSSHHVVTEPFKDGGSYTIIWKIPVAPQNLDKTALEKVIKELYDRAVMEKDRAVKDAVINSSTVVINDCNERI